MNADIDDMKLGMIVGLFAGVFGLGCQSAPERVADGEPGDDAEEPPRVAVEVAGGVKDAVLENIDTGWELQWATGGRLGMPLYGRQTAVGAFEFSPDGRWLVGLTEWDYVGGFATTGPHVWDTETGRLVWSSPLGPVGTYRGGVGIDVGPESSRIVLVRYHGDDEAGGWVADIRNIRTGERTRQIELSGESEEFERSPDAVTPRFSPTGEYLIDVAAAADEGPGPRLVWYDIETGELERITTPGPDGETDEAEVSDVALSPSGSFVAWREDDRFRIATVDSGDVLATVPVSGFRDATFGPDESNVAIEGRRLRIVDLEEGEVASTFEICPEEIGQRGSTLESFCRRRAEFPDDNYGLLSRDNIGSVAVDWHHPEGVRPLVVFTPDRARGTVVFDIVAGETTGRFDPCSGEEVDEPPRKRRTGCEAERAYELIVSPDGRRVGRIGVWPRTHRHAANSGGVVRLFDAGSGRSAGEGPRLLSGTAAGDDRGAAGLRQLMAIPDAERIVSVSDEIYTGVRSWSLVDGGLEAVYLADGAARLSVSPTGRRFAAVGDGERSDPVAEEAHARVWEFGDPAPVVDVAPGELSAEMVAWSGDRPRFATEEELLDEAGERIENRAFPDGLTPRFDIRSDDGSRVVAEDEEGRVVVVDMGMEPGPVARHEVGGEVVAGGFDVSGETLGLIVEKGESDSPDEVALVAVRNGDDKPVVRRRYDGEFRPDLVAVTPEGRRFAVAAGGRVRIVDGEGEESAVADRGGKVRALEFVADDDLVVGYRDGRLERWRG